MKQYSDSVEIRARAIPIEERPVAARNCVGFASFLGIYGGEHIAATEFVIGTLLVTWGVPLRELVIGLIVGNLLAAASYALVTAPIAVTTRLTLFAYLRKITGPWFQRVYNATWGVVSIVWAASMMAIAATSLKAAVGLPVQTCWYPTSAGCVGLTLTLVMVTVLVAACGFGGVVRFSSLCVPWMVAVFFCGAAVGLSVLCLKAGMEVRNFGDIVDVLREQVFTGVSPRGGGGCHGGTSPPFAGSVASCITWVSTTCRFSASRAGGVTGG